MSDPLTVILPVRNGETTVARAVRSTLLALPADGRLLVHDDASTDQTAQVLQRFEDPRLTIFRSEQARGVAGGLNYLLEQVRTPLMARMDADDVSLQWRFRNQTRTLDRGADVVFSTVIGIGDVPGRIRPGPPIPISADAMPLHLLIANPVAHSSMLARTEVLTDAGGYRQVPAEDYDLWLRICESGRRCVRMALPTILYRFHAGQVTAGAGWAGQSSADPQLRASYAALSHRVLGRAPDWYDDLTRAGRSTDTDTGDGQARMRRFGEAITAAAASLTPLQRQFLLRKLGALLAAPRL